MGNTHWGLNRTEAICQPYVKPKLMLIKLDIMPKAKPAAIQEAKQEPEPRGWAPIQAIVMPKRGKPACGFWVSGIIIINGPLM